MPQYEIGEQVIYEGKTTEVRIVQGPRNTVGIIDRGNLKMVHESKISKKIEEGVLGGVQAMPTINRMLQLAGLEHSGAVVAEEVTGPDINEDANDDMLSKLQQSAENMPQYKGNAEAARFYAAGSILAMLGKSFADTPPQTVVGQQKLQALNTLTAMGADFIKSADTMSKAATGANAASGAAAQS